MKSLKIMLFGLALIAMGIFGTLIKDTWPIAGVGVFLPFIGILICIIGLFMKK